MSYVSFKIVSSCSDGGNRCFHYTPFTNYFSGYDSVRGCYAYECDLNLAIFRVIDFTTLLILVAICFYLSFPEKGSRLFLWKL